LLIETSFALVLGSRALQELQSYIAAGLNSKAGARPEERAKLNK